MRRFFAIALGALFLAPCSSSEPTAKEDTPDVRVGNDDPRGVDNQPDWDALAENLVVRLDGRLPGPADASSRAEREKACNSMLDAAREYYESTERDPLQRADRLAKLEATRPADLEGCVADTSLRAVECTKLLLAEREGELPYALDQCSRAFPRQKPQDGSAAAKGGRAEALELTFVGDIIFGRYREAGFDPIVRDGHEPFAELATQLDSDVLVGNLETPVVEVIPERSPIGSKYRFAAGRAEAKVLRSSGFDVVSQANNHFFDLREPGQIEGPKILREEGLFVIGSSRPREEPSPFRIETFEAKGWKIGFLAMTTRRNAPQFDRAPVLPFADLRDVSEIALPLLAEARASHDLLVVFVHWGDEYAETPGRYTERVAHELVDGGADLVVGHHPHVLQGIEHYQGRVIAYSLGNFLFEHTGAIPRLTGVLRTRFTGGGEGRACLETVTFHPAYMTRLPIRHPTPATEGMGKRVRARVVEQASGLGTTFEQVEGSEDLRLAGLPACG